MKLMKKLLIIGAVCVTSAIAAQENLRPLTYQPFYANDPARNNQQPVVLDTIALPSNGFRDNFMYDSRRPDTTMWDLSLNPGVYVNRGWATAPINLGVCTFDGLDPLGLPYDQLASVNSSMLCDVLTSRHFDLSGYTVSDSVYLSFWWEAQGKGYAPNQVDSLQLQVNIPAWNTAGEVWKTIWYMEGYNPTGTDTSFHVAMLKLDTSIYFVDGFRFRFRNYASGCGSNDHWHIDEVLFKPQRTFDDTLINDVFFVYNMPSLFDNYHQVPGAHYAASSMASNIKMYIRNNDTVVRNVTYSYEVYQPGNPTPLYTYSGGADGNLAPFRTNGYSAYAPHSNASVTYAYTPFSAPDTGYYYVNHMLKKGSAPTSPVDTVPYYQRMYNAYAYDDGTAEVGYGLYGTGALLAYRFDMPALVTDTLTAIQMYFLPVLDIDNLIYRQFRLTVWNHNSSTNGPGSIIYQQRGATPTYAADVPNRFETYTIDSGIVVVSGTFYVGWQQEGTDRLYLGMDFENDQKDKIYYNTSGVWYTSIYSGCLMMRPVFGEPYDLSGVNESPELQNVNVYPNPADDYITVSGLNSGMNYTAQLVDLSGRVVVSNTITSDNAQLATGELTAGVYLLNITYENGIRSKAQKVIVR
jgi:hypothetical protein